MNVDIRVRVTAVRSQGTRAGGAIFTGVRIENDGSIVRAGEYIVIRASGSVVAQHRIERGQWWRVAGEAHSRTTVVNGYVCEEQQLEAREAQPLRPSGEHIIAFMADNPAFIGIGLVKARRLWDAFGPRLYEVLDTSDAASLEAVLTPEAARSVLEAWASHGDAQTLQWLHANGIDIGLGRKLIQFWGREARQEIEADPYRLLSFCAKWEQADQLARKQFGTALDDPRRLRAAVEEAGYRLMNAGHTVIERSMLGASLVSILGSHRLARLAVNIDATNASYVQGPAGLQTLGAWVLESTVAKAITTRLSIGGGALMPSSRVAAIINDFEHDERFTLTDEQRAAIHVAASNAFACITGGAGVGKTTVLKALYRVYDAACARVVQIALAGRAAKRMQEATKRPAQTIAGFLQSFKEGSLDGAGVVVIDEASMVDIIAMSRLCDIIPPHVRILLVGDTAQLMPVGPGLVLHAVTGLPAVPTAELKVVKRFGNVISAAASAVRRGAWPSLPNDHNAPISFIRCADARMMTTLILDFYSQDPHNTQILAARRNGSAGIRELNDLCQARCHLPA